MIAFITPSSPSTQSVVSSRHLVYSPRESRHSTDPNIQQKNIWVQRNAYHWTTSLPDTHPGPDNSKSPYVGLVTPLVNTMIIPPIEPHPQFLFGNLNIHSYECQPRAGLLKASLRWEWSHPFCSRPLVGSSNGPKPMVMRWSERVLPEDQCFSSTSPKKKST